MKSLLAIGVVCGVLAAGQAFAADKLIVQDATGTATVFKVDDTGMVTAARAASRSARLPRKNS